MRSAAEPAPVPMSSYDGPHAVAPSPPLCAPEPPIDSQEELNALEGCEVASTRLYIDFAFADLRPLYALRVAEQGLGIGGRFPVGSLDGLERLERASLELRSFRGSDLHALRSLKSLEVGRDGQLQAGDLVILDAPELQSLAGLEGLALGRGGLDIEGVPRLVSLAPLVLPSQMKSLYLGGAPLLADIDASSSLESVDFLSLRDTGIQTLDALRLLRRASIELARNPALVDASGIGNIEAMEALAVRQNPALRSLPAFERLVEVTGGIVLEDNASLESIGAFPALTAMPRLSIVNDPGLTSIAAWPALASVGQLSVARNESLSALSFGALTTVRSWLIVASNPRLPAASVARLEQVDAPFRKLVANRDDVPLVVEGECPWEGDGFCDEDTGAVLCAPNTDRDCPSYE